ncbi:MAG: hypothetical protein ACWGQW_00530 [bacterium]
MNIRDTVDALRALGKDIALDVGEHGYCTLESNCPVAVTLRTYISEMDDVNLLDILEQDEQLRTRIDADLPDISAGDLNGDISAVATIRFMGTETQVDLSESLNQEINWAVRRKIDELNEERSRYVRMEAELFDNLKRAIREAKKVTVLPQLKFDYSTLMELSPMLGTDGQGRYTVTMPFYYHPEAVYHNGTRYTLHPDDAEVIKRDVIIMFYLNPNGTVYKVDLLNIDGSHFRHYHGNTGRDCWGSVRWSPSEHGRIDDRFLYALMRMAQGSLATINYDSPLNRQPDGMPTLTSILRRSTTEGREGMRDAPRTAGRVGTGTGIGTGWGRMRTGG